MGERELVLLVSVRYGKEWDMTRGWQIFLGHKDVQSWAFQLLSHACSRDEMWPCCATLYVLYLRVYCSQQHAKQRVWKSLLRETLAACPLESATTCMSAWALPPGLDANSSPRQVHTGDANTNWVKNGDGDTKLAAPFSLSLSLSSHLSFGREMRNPSGAMSGERGICLDSGDTVTKR